MPRPVSHAHKATVEDATTDTPETLSEEVTTEAPAVKQEQQQQQQHPGDYPAPPQPRPRSQSVPPASTATPYPDLVYVPPDPAVSASVDRIFAGRKRSLLHARNIQLRSDQFRRLLADCYEDQDFFGLPRPPADSKWRLQQTWEAFESASNELYRYPAGRNVGQKLIREVDPKGVIPFKVVAKSEDPPGS